MEERLDKLIADIQELLKEPTHWKIREAMALLEAYEKITGIANSKRCYEDLKRNLESKDK